MNPAGVADGAGTGQNDAGAPEAGQTDTGPGDAGAGGVDGGGAGPATSCNNPAYILCADFENLGPSEVPKGFEAPPGGVPITQDASVSGSHSLRFDSAQGDKRLVARNVPGTHWGRVYLRVEVSMNGPNTYMHSAFVESNVTRMVDSVNRSDGKHNWKYNVGHAAEPNTDYVYQWDPKQWICAEWHSEPGVGTYGHWAFYLDGQPIPALTGVFNIATIPQIYDWMKFGVIVFQGGARVAGWMDDIAISTERVGCDLMTKP
jgi:hypothetical protein